MGENNDASRVRVGGRKAKFQYVEYAKHRLHEGTPELVFSGLGSAIGDAVSVVELLKSQGLVTVTEVKTYRGEAEGARSDVVDKINITVVKSTQFDKIFEEQRKAREEKQQEAS